MTASVRLDYFYGSEVKTGSFYRVPKAFEVNDFYRAASIEVKYLYGVMLDRVGLSARNGWLDEGRVFIYFTLKDVVECIHAGKNKAVQVIREMEKLGLIQRKKQGQGKPARVFLKNIIEEKTEKQNPENVETAEQELAWDNEPETGNSIHPDADSNSGVMDADSAVEKAVESVEELENNPASAQDVKWDIPAPASDPVPEEKPLPVLYDDPNLTVPAAGFPAEDLNARNMSVEGTDTPECESTVAPEYDSQSFLFGGQCALNDPLGVSQTSDFGKSALPETGTQDFLFGDPCALNAPLGASQTSDFGKSALPETGSQDFPIPNPNYNNMNLLHPLAFA